MSVQLLGTAPVGTIAHGVSVLVAPPARETATVHTLHLDGVPTSAAFSPDGVTAYVNVGTQVCVIDVATGIRTGSFELGGTAARYLPRTIAVSPDGTRAYLTIPLDYRLGGIDLVTGTVLEPIDLTSPPDAVAFSPDGASAYVTTPGQRVSIIDVPRHRVGQVIGDIGYSPSAVAFSPDGTLACTGNAYFGGLSIIDTRSQTLVRTVLQGITVRAVAFSPSGATAYIAHTQAVSVVRMADLTVTETLTITGTVTGLAVSPDGRTLCLTNATDSHVAIITVDHQHGVAGYRFGDPIPVGRAPASIAVTPDGQSAYVLSALDPSISVLRFHPAPVPFDGLRP